MIWNIFVDGFFFIGKVGVNYWIKYDKVYWVDIYFDDSKIVGFVILNVWIVNNMYIIFEVLVIYEK